MMERLCLGGSVADLVGLGKILDGPAIPPRLTTMGAFLAEKLLKVRDRRGRWVALKPNRAQLEYDRRRGQSNIVLKARQMGITTWVAGRFFLKTITQPGTLTVQVAHTQAAAGRGYLSVRASVSAWAAVVPAAPYSADGSRQCATDCFSGPR